MQPTVNPTFNHENIFPASEITEGHVLDYPTNKDTYDSENPSCMPKLSVGFPESYANILQIPSPLNARFIDMPALDDQLLEKQNYFQNFDEFFNS